MRAYVWIIKSGGWEMVAHREGRGSGGIKEKIARNRGESSKAWTGSSEEKTKVGSREGREGRESEGRRRRYRIFAGHYFTRRGRQHQSFPCLPDEGETVLSTHWLPTSSLYFSQSLEEKNQLRHKNPQQTATHSPAHQRADPAPAGTSARRGYSHAADVILRSCRPKQRANQGLVHQG
jgi:hypothetical protein